MRVYNHIDSKEISGFRVNQLIVMARKLYDKIPSRLRCIAFPMIFFFRFCRLISKLRLKLWILTGNERNSLMPLSILYADNDRNAQPNINKNFMLGLMFGESYQKEYLGRAWMWNIQKVISEKGQGCSLIVIQVYKSMRKLLRPSHWFYIPNWVVGEADIPRDLTITKDNSLKSDFRRIRKNSLRFEVTKDPQRFDDFYHNMYVPQITKAHGSSAYILSYEYMRTEFQKYDLLLVLKQQKSIAGILITYDKRGPRLWALGVRDSNPQYIKDGAVGALYYFSMAYLHDKGFTKVELGLSRAFLGDGVLRYKKKWSQQILGYFPHGYALKVLSYQGAAGAFLQKNPFIFESCGKLHGAVFVDGDDALSPKKIKQIDKHNYHLGLSKLFIYHLQHGDTVNQKSVPPELSERIVLGSIEDITLRIKTQELEGNRGSIGERKGFSPILE